MLGLADIFITVQMLCKKNELKLLIFYFFIYEKTRRIKFTTRFLLAATSQDPALP